MLLPRASDLEEEPTIDWNKVLDNMQGTPLNVKFKLAVCPSGFVQCWQWVTPFFRLCTVKCVMLVCIIVHFYYIFMSIIESSISTLSMPVYAYDYTCLWF